MKKSELIKKLNEINGDPEVLVWNGFVGDYQKVSSNVEETMLFKECADSIFKNLVFEEMKNRKSFDELPEDLMVKLRAEAKEYASKREWELRNLHFDDETVKRVYGKNKKKVVILELKNRGKEAFDRLGTFSY